MTDSKNIRPIRSFVRRQGRMTKAQQYALEHYWQQFTLEVADGFIAAETIFQNQNPVILDIGFGMGEALLQMALSRPDQNYIGVEVHKPGVGALLAELKKNEVENVRIFCDDAHDVLKKSIKDQSIDRVQIFFPDPWHKKRHHKRRLIQKPFIDLVCQKLKSKAIIHLATDWQDYALWMLDVLNDCKALKNLGNPFVEKPKLRPTTRFEQRGHRLGHPVWDLVFRKD